MSEIRATTISDAAGTGPITLTKQSAAKAWASIDGVTPAIYNSFNVSSVTEAQAGIWYSTMTNAMSADQQFTTSVTSISFGDARTSTANTASIFYTIWGNTSFTLADTQEIFGVVHGDLA